MLRGTTIAMFSVLLAGCAAHKQSPSATTAKPASASAAATAPASTRADIPRQIKRVVVWDGEEAKTGAGWAHPGCSIGPQTTEAHSGKTAVEFRFKGTTGIWLGAGWNWCAFKTGSHGTDITGMTTVSFWIKKKGTSADLQINLLCNGKQFDMPEHHTEKVSVRKYSPQLDDGEWHEVIIPLADLPQPKGFDALHVGELQMFNAGDGDESFFLDDIGFDNRILTE